MHRRLAILISTTLGLASLVGTTAAEEIPRIRYIGSPYEDAATSKQLFDVFELRAVELSGYNRAIPPQLDDVRLWVHPLLSPLTEGVRRFVKLVPEKTVQTLELYLAKGPDGQFFFEYDGSAFDWKKDKASCPTTTQECWVRTGVNEDILKIRELSRTLANELALEVLKFETYDLRFVEAEHAVALLSALQITVTSCKRPEESKTTDPNPNKVQCDPPGGPLPWVIGLADASSWKLGTLPAPAKSDTPILPNIVPLDIKGATAGNAVQRLLLVSSAGTAKQINSIKNLLRDQIDQPARQLRVDALIVEIDESASEELGLSFFGTAERSGPRDKSTLGASSGDGISDVTRSGNAVPPPAPFLFSVGRTAFDNVFDAQARLKALIANNKAKILSNPSVLVLDGRQATIHIGQSVPVETTTVSNLNSVSTSASYFPVGILLNLRPRVSLQVDSAAEVLPQTEVVMQVETVISSVPKVGLVQTGTASTSSSAPLVESRKVQTTVRVANDTPFIIGGLISSDEENAEKNIPGIAKIPVLKLLFRQRQKESTRREVIVVVTPHVLPLDPVESARSGHVLPVPNSVADQQKNKLFRNSYRLRPEDIYDLRFLSDNEELTKLKIAARPACADPKYNESDICTLVARDGLPGESALVLRMLYALLRRQGLASMVELNHIIFFDRSPNEYGPSSAAAESDACLPKRAEAPPSWL